MKSHIDTHSGHHAHTPTHTVCLFNRTLSELVVCCLWTAQATLTIHCPNHAQPICPEMLVVGRVSATTDARRWPQWLPHGASVIQRSTVNKRTKERTEDCVYLKKKGKGEEEVTKKGRGRTPCQALWIRGRFQKQKNRSGGERSGLPSTIFGSSHLGPWKSSKNRKAADGVRLTNVCTGSYIVQQFISDKSCHQLNHHYVENMQPGGDGKLNFLEGAEQIMTIENSILQSCKVFDGKIQNRFTTTASAVAIFSPLIFRF